MDQKTFVEGARAFIFWGATLIDRAHRKGDAEAEALISLLTPVIKGFLTDKGFETTVLAQQTLGGSGFIREWGLEQFVRDARITMIYEGANGIQSLDLVGRKLGQNGGKTVMAFFDIVKAFIRENEHDARLKADFLDPLKAASKDLQAAAMYFMQNGMKDPNDALAGSYDFMHLFGHVCLGLMWARMAQAAYAALDAGDVRPRVPRGQDRHRALLHGAPAARDADASRADRIRRRAGHGARRQRILERALPPDARRQRRRSNRRVPAPADLPPPRNGNVPETGTEGEKTMTAKLYCFGESGNAYKAALTMELAGIDWEPVFVDFFNGETRTPDYRKLNPMGEVPVLVDGDSS